MTQQSGGTSYPGVTSDPDGGLIVDGTFTAHKAIDAGGTGSLDFNTLHGSTSFVDTFELEADDDPVQTVAQQVGLTHNLASEAVKFRRYGPLNGFEYQAPLATTFDFSGSTAPIESWGNADATQFQVDQDGVQIHGKFKTGAAVTHTLGAYSGESVPIYDEAGTLLGYMPLYA